MYICSSLRRYNTANHVQEFSSCVYSPFSITSMQRSYLIKSPNVLLKLQHGRFMSNSVVTLEADNDVVRFCLDKPSNKVEVRNKGKNKLPKRKMSRKAKVNELRLYRLKAKKKMTSPNPEVRIRYKLEKVGYLNCTFDVFSSWFDHYLHTLLLLFFHFNSYAIVVLLSFRRKDAWIHICSFCCPFLFRLFRVSSFFFSLSVYFCLLTW